MITNTLTVVDEVEELNGKKTIATLDEKKSKFFDCVLHKT